MSKEFKYNFSIKNLNYFFGNQQVLKNINLNLNNSTYCLLGESGSGKTTLAKVLATLNNKYFGEIYYKDYKYNLHDKENISFIRKRVRLIFQSPETTLNPRMSIYKILKEPLKLYSKNRSHSDRILEIENVLDKVKLSELKKDIKQKKISELSGGQKRRVAIARAIISKPEFIIADEPTEGLDISLQGGIIELFRELNLPMLLITHNYSVAAALGSQTGIMYQGEIIDEIYEGLDEAKHKFSILMRDSLKKIENT